MNRFRSTLAFPQSGDARETLQWVRRAEIGMGVVGLIAAGSTWSGQWWSWLLFGASLLSLSPWPGVGGILRKAETDPEILIADPERRSERGRRFLRYFIPFYVVIFTVIGYLVEGLVGAVVFLVLGGLGAGLGAWMFAKMNR